MGLGQSQQVSLGAQDLPESVAERCTQIAGLAGLLGDDQGRHAPYPTQFCGIAHPGSGNIQRKCRAQAWGELPSRMWGDDVAEHFPCDRLTTQWSSMDSGYMGGQS